MENVQPVDYVEDPIYRAALGHLQKGEWEPGLYELEKLAFKYPLEHELRALRQTMRIRAGIDKDEREDRRMARLQRLKKWSIRFGVLTAVLVLGFFALQYSSGWLGQQLAVAREVLANEQRSVELAAAFRDAQDLLQAGRSGEALVKFQEVAAQDPEYPQVAAYLSEAAKKAELDGQYDEAMRLLNLGDREAALDKFKEIAAQETYYRDVSLRISELENQLVLDETIQGADAAYQAGNWEAAIQGYEKAREIDPDYQNEKVEENLFLSYIQAAQDVINNQPKTLETLQRAEAYFSKSLALRPRDEKAMEERDKARGLFEESLFWTYVKAAQAALAGQEDSLVAQSVAENYFTKALALRPNDPEINTQRELAASFLRSQDYFGKSLWSEVISELEFVNTQDPGYANGAARQTLYEAYVARGNAEIAKGEYESALEDYQSAAVIAEQGSESVIRSYEAQLKVAEAQGLLGNYETAVRMYRTAVDFGGVLQRAQENNPSLQSALQDAETFADQRDFKSAFKTYRDAVLHSYETYARVTHVVQLGEYLTLLAARYHTTVTAIAQLNGIANPNLIYAGQELLIPVLPGEAP